MTDELRYAIHGCLVDAIFTHGFVGAWYFSSLLAARDALSEQLKEDFSERK